MKLVVEQTVVLAVVPGLQKSVTCRGYKKVGVLDCFPIREGSMSNSFLKPRCLGEPSQELKRRLKLQLIQKSDWDPPLKTHPKFLGS